MSLLALVVEDDKSLRLIYRKVLEDMGYDVLEASEGQGALELLNQHQPNILFLDIQLPRVSGVDVLDYIYTANHLQHMHTVIVSSNKRYETYAEEMRSTDFVLKPIRPAQIRDFAKLHLA